jgi:hypothetical protein
MKGRDKRLKEIVSLNLGEQSKAAQRVLDKRAKRRNSFFYKIKVLFEYL